MPVLLERATVRKLTHESAEIRLRTLEQIVCKIERALAHNEVLEFPAGELCKQLIRWFGYQPLQVPTRVLHLLRRLLRSFYGRQAIKELGLERWKREIGKVEKFLNVRLHTEELEIIGEIQQLLHEYQQDMHHDLDVVGEMIEKITSDSASYNSKASVPEFRLNNTQQFIICPTVDYEVPWSRPSSADFNSIKFIADIFADPSATCIELRNALQHLQITMCDYPTEYMLQSPYVYLNLLHLFDLAEDPKCLLEDVANTILTFLQNLIERLHMRFKVLAYAAQTRSITQGLCKTQLKIGKAIQLLLEKCMRQLNMRVIKYNKETILILQIIFSTLKLYEMQHLAVERDCLLKLYSIAEKLRECCAQNEHFTLLRIKYLLITFMLQNIAQNNAMPKPVEYIKFFEPLLKDYTLKANYAKRYKSLQELLIHADPSMETKCETLTKYEQSFAAAISLLKEPANGDTKCSKIIADSTCICIALEKLKSFKLTEQLFNAVVNCNVQYPANFDLKMKANDLLLNLLRLQHEPLKVFVYNKLVCTVKKHFSCLMNGEYYCEGMPNSQLLEAQILGVPLSTTLMLQLINDSFECTHVKVKQICVDILTLLLKSQHLWGNNWMQCLDVLLPVLPMLQCCVNSSKIMQQLLDLYNPDALHLPFLPVLQGNIIFLFNRETSLRAEALTRLVYLLNTMPDAQLYVPNVIEISDLLPNDLCLLQSPLDYRHIFINSTPCADISILHNLLSLLDTPDIEPLIRKTTLMQLNVMCQHWEMTRAFCNEGASYLILKALESSLLKASYADYSDAAIPAISILAKVLYVDSEERQLLADKPNIYVLLLRALCIYQNDTQLRQDASICLCLLIFSNYLVVIGCQGIEAPQILSNLKTPLRCELKNITQSNWNFGLQQQYKQIFSNECEEEQYLRYLIATNFCDYGKITKKYFELQEQYDFDTELKLTQRDWRMMKATNTEQNLKRFLRAISNATAHNMLINGVISVELQLLLQGNFELELNNEIALELFKMLNKYLQLPPGNELDFLLFEHLLDLCDLCICMSLHAVIEHLYNTLQNDYQHAFLLLLKNPEVPVRLYNKICVILTHLLYAVESSETLQNMPSNSPTKPSISCRSVFYSNIFEFLFDQAQQLFERRDLQRVRCLLSLMQLISSRHLDMSDKNLLHYCKRFLNLSLALKSFTQTGAQWQRDCLRMICQLGGQMSHPEHTFKLNISAVKYLSGLCGHNDKQVRALAWCILTQIALYKDEVPSLSGINMLLNELSYLPGGFLACCLCTLLDADEIILVRQYAGNLFIELLIKSPEKYKEAHLLLEQYSCFTAANEALSACMLETTLPIHFDFVLVRNISSCEIISCLVRIFIAMAELDESFLSELCEKDFMFKLYELFKLPPAHNNITFYAMCADICQLYGICYARNFAFLQRTLCRDHVWLMSFCQLLNQPNGKETHIVNVLQLLLILCKDASAYEKLIEKIVQAPDFIVKLFMRAFKISHINTPLQRCALAVLSFLLIRSQLEIKGEYKSFSDSLQTPLEIIDLQFVELNGVKHKDTGHNTHQLKGKRSFTNSESCDNLKAKYSLEKLNNFTKSCENLKAHSITKRKYKLSVSAENLKDEEDHAAALKVGLKVGTITTATSTPASYIFNELFRIFSHLYSTKACKFESTPSTAQTQITETLAVLLKLSTQAHESAKNLNFFGKILNIFNIFFEDFKSSATTFVRRYGDTKKIIIIKNFQILLNILQCWFSSHHAILTDSLQSLEFCKMLMQIWPWLAHSTDLKLQALKVCEFLSEHSFIVCQQFSTLISSYTHSTLQLIAKIVTFETTKVKASNTENFPIIATGLRVVMNCCACTEGRVTLVKAHILDIFDSLHPFNFKSPKIKLDILHNWLQFWELFSRYPEGAQARNINSLCALVNRTPALSATRLLPLKILRNMCFHPGNRSSLITNSDFIYTMNEILTQPLEACDSYEEHLLISVAIWKLVSGGVKYVAIVRGSKLAKKFRIAQEHLNALKDDYTNSLQHIVYAQELANVLDVLLDIFNN